MGGVDFLRKQAAVLVIVVLSFSTAVDVAVSKRAAVYPFPDGDENAAQAAAGRVGAVLAKHGGDLAVNSAFRLSAS